MVELVLRSQDDFYFFFFFFFLLFFFLLAKRASFSRRRAGSASQCIYTRYGSRELRKLFRDHANQPGALGHAIETWNQYDEVIILLISSSLWATQTGVLLANSLFQIRGARQLEPTDFLNAQRNDQSHCNYVPEPILGGESRASRPLLVNQMHAM